MNKLSARSGTILAFLAIALILGFAVTGMGFGLWIQQFTVQQTLASGNVDLVFTAAFTDDDGVVNDVLVDSQDNASSTEIFDAWGAGSSADPAATGPDPKSRYDKDVARCLALMDGSVSQDSAYPSYNCTSWFEMQNSGTIPVKVKRIRVNTVSGARNLAPGGSPVPADLDNADLDGDDTTGADAEIGVSDLAICQQIDPGETVRVAVAGHGLQAAPQGAVLIYTLDVETAQWNELATSTDALTDLYDKVFQILGPDGVVIPLGDFPPGEFRSCPGTMVPGGNGFDSSTFATEGGSAEVFAWSAPPASFDTAAALQGFIPVVTFNGTDEEADSPDAALWSAGADGSPGNEPMLSVGAWVKTNTNKSSVILDKVDLTSGSTKREWLLQTLTGGGFGVVLYDESSGAWIGRNYVTPIPNGEWHHLACTYDGTRVTSGVRCYRDGVQVDNASNSGGPYTAMENTASQVRLGYSQGTGGPSNFLDASLAGGPLGPFFVGRELSSSEVLKLYDLGASALGLGP